MPDFETYVSRHGECWVQSLVEMIERHEGVRHQMAVPLKERWDFVMNDVLPVSGGSQAITA